MLCANVLAQSKVRTVRNTTDVYAVNGMAVHPQTGTFATVGADGRICFWDKEKKSICNKIGDPTKGVLNPITAVKYNQDGSLLAYAKGYDWHMGPPQPGMPQFPTEIYVRQTIQNDVKKLT